MQFPPQFLDEIRARVSVSDVVGRHVQLKRRGREYVGLSPFNKEKTPSFTVNDEKRFYHCFSSGNHGDVFSFVMFAEGLTFPEAVEKLAREAGLDVPRATPQERERAKRAADLADVVEAACAWFEAQLAAPAGAAARDYLAGRGLDDATIGRFRLGYAPDGRGRLARALKAQGIGEDRLIEAGLMKRADDGATRDYFFNRVVFPIADRRGRVIAFGGRTLGDGTPKYLNSPETPLFHKGRVLYGLATAREAAHKTREVMVVEGYMDVIALARAGLDHAVAPLGTALTEEQLVELWRLADEPVLCFDGDAAGERAAFRAAERALPLLKPGKSLRFVTLPPGEDPDTLVASRGPAGMTALVAGARPLVEVVWLMQTRGRADTPERRAAIERELMQRAAAIGDGTVQQHYRQAFRDRLAAAFGQRRAPQPGRPRGGPNWRRQPPGREAPRPAALGLAARGDVATVKTAQERILLALLVNHPGLVEGHAEALAEIGLADPSLDRMLREIIHLCGSVEGVDTAVLKRQLTAQGLDGPLATVTDGRVYRQAACAAPDGAVDEADRAVAEFLAWHRRQRMGEDRAQAQRKLADEMTDENARALQGIVRDQARGGS